MMQPASERKGGTDRLDRPRFRQDLVAEPIEEQGGRFIDVMDLDSGNLFRFYEVEYSLACAMDGERDVPGIVKWAHEELGLSASAQEVRTVIATLGELGFIDSGDARAAAGEPSLAAGVVANAPSPSHPTSDVELGSAGSSAPSRREPLPSAPPLALGASGGASARRSAESVEDVALGAPGRNARATPAPPVGATSDVSIDLADHIAVRRDDVKEAVRASKVMSAVDVPKDLLDALEDKPIAKPEPKARPADLMKPPLPAPLRAEAPKPEPRAEADTKVGKPPLTRPSSATKPPVELPKPPPVVEKQPVPSSAPRAGVSPVLIVVLILAVLGAGGFLVWRYVLNKPQGTEVDTTAEPAAPVVKPAPPAPPPPPPPPTAKVTLETPAPEEIRLAGPGVVETILADKATVKAGDVVVKLVGDKPIEAEITALTRDVKRVQDQVDASERKRANAQAAGNKAAEASATTEVADRQKTLTTKKTQLAAKTTDLKRFLLLAPSNGTFSPAAKLGQKLAANAVVAKLQRDAVPVATFKVADAKPFAAGASVDLAIGKGEQRVACTVAEVQTDGVKVSCPSEAAMAEGTDVTLQPPVAAPEAAPAPAPTETGSAAAPEAPAGSAAAPEAPVPAPAK